MAVQFKDTRLQETRYSAVRFQLEKIVGAATHSTLSGDPNTIDVSRVPLVARAFVEGVANGRATVSVDEFQGAIEKAAKALVDANESIFVPGTSVVDRLSARQHHSVSQSYFESAEIAVARKGDPRVDSLLTSLKQADDEWRSAQGVHRPGLIASRIRREKAEEAERKSKK